MNVRTFRRRRVLAVSLTTAAAATTLFAIAGAAGPAAAATGTGCPSSKSASSLPTASNVAAAFSNNGKVSTYQFSSLANQNPASGVPGLIRYCVYPTSPSASPTAISVQAHGGNGALWLSGTGKGNFAFVRPGGNASNIPLDGNATVMGTATWGTVPAAQTIVLHINDPSTCASLIPGSTSATCFVKPGAGPICNAGDNSVAYNAMPFGALNCPKPSEAFEAQSASEFGNAVNLKPGTPRTLGSLSVLFSSYGCSQSGHWYSGTTDPCVTTPGATFTWPITANIYALDTSTTPPSAGALLATDTETQTIPFRPSGDPSCPGSVADGTENGSAWFNPQAPGGGRCQYSISAVLSFSNWAYQGSFTGTLPSQVIWTVAFNTSDFGPAPQRPQPCNSTDQGCPYDSLNVGVMTFPGSEYAGSSVDPHAAFLSSTWTGAYCDGGAGGTGFLRMDTSGTDCWQGYTPLAEITTTP